MKSHYTQLEAERLLKTINRFKGEFLFKESEEMVFERAFIFPTKAPQSIIDIVRDCSSAEKTLPDILIDLPYHYDEFDIAIEFRESGIDGLPMMGLTEELKQRFKIS